MIAIMFRRSIRLSIVGLSLAALAGCGKGTPSVLDISASTTSVPSLTSSGALLESFEALLIRTFGQEPVFVSSGNDFSCSGTCEPLASYSPYTFTFTEPTGSGLQIATSSPPSGSSFGNYPTPILIKGRYITCDNANTKYLVRYRDDASFTLTCLAPLP